MNVEQPKTRLIQFVLSGPPVPEIGIRTTWRGSHQGAKSRPSDWFGQSPERFSLLQLA